MARSRFQDGAETSHYHDRLGVEGDITGEQTIRLLGPFVVNYNTPGVEDEEGALLSSEELAVGTVIMDYWAEGVVGFDPDPGDQWIALNVATAADPAGTYASLKFLDMEDAGQRLGTATIGVEVLLDPSAKVPAVLRTATQLRVNIKGTNMSAGQIKVYALIAEPS